MDDVDRVGVGLLDDREEDRVLAVHGRVGGGVLDGVADRAEVLELDLGAPRGGDVHPGEVLEALELAHGAQGQLAGIRVDLAAGQVVVLGLDGLEHAGQAQVVGLQALGVEGDLVGALDVTQELDLGDALHALELGLDDVLHVRGEGHVGHVAGDGVVDDRRHAGAVAQVGGRTNVLGELPEDARDLVSDIVGRVLGRDLELHLADDLGDAVVRGRGQVLEAVDARERVLDGLGDEGLDLGGSSTGIHRLHDDDRELDVGEQLKRHAEERPQPQKADDEHHDDGRDRVLDEEGREVVALLGIVPRELGSAVAH
ncbi:hypothetical protein D3C86_1303280 [compost metagenome]